MAKEKEKMFIAAMHKKFKEDPTEVLRRLETVEEEAGVG